MENHCERKTFAFSYLNLISRKSQHVVEGLVPRSFNFLLRLGLSTFKWKRKPLTHLFRSCRFSFLDQVVWLQVHQWNQPGIRNHLPWQPGRRQTPLPKEMRRIISLHGLLFVRVVNPGCTLFKHRHAVRAEPMTYLICAVNEWWMVSTVCNRNWIEWMNYLYLVFKLGRTAKTSRAPRMFRVEDTLSPTSLTTHFSAL